MSTGPSTSRITGPGQRGPAHWEKETWNPLSTTVPSWASHNADTKLLAGRVRHDRQGRYQSTLTHLQPEPCTGDQVTDESIIVDTIVIFSAWSAANQGISKSSGDLTY